MGLAGRAPVRHVVQSLLAPLGGLPGDLYLRSSLRPAEEFVQQSGSALRLDLHPGEILSTDTFFGSFYHQYWTTHTVLGDLTIRVDLRGAGVVRVVRDDGQGVEVLADVPPAADAASASERRVVEVPLHRSPLPGAESGSSRVFVEVEAIDRCSVTAIDVVTDTSPPAAPALSVGLCTFNREEMLTGTLAQLIDFADDHESLVGVHVVNQGEPFTTQAIQPMLQHPKVHVVDQRNLGGAGGFTRSILEAETASHLATHHLLMDDDVFLDARFLRRAITFLSYARRDIAVGAGMLDSLHPRVMYEAGAFVNANNVIEPYCHNVDLSHPGTLWRFNKPVDTDYNAWWFCIVPLERCRKIGLPNPVFIRGDDFEYGQRLAADGVRTVTLPGIAVWHEPFHAKPPGWQDYYDLRNRLIFGATHPDAVVQLSRAHILGALTKAVLSQQYSVARLRLRAVRDFLGGPEQLFAHDPAVLHSQILAIASTDGPTRLVRRDLEHSHVRPGKLMPGTMAPVIATQLLALMRAAFGPRRRRKAPLVLDIHANPRNIAGRDYVMTNGARTFYLGFRASKRLTWALTWKSLVLGIGFGRRVERAGRAWQDGVGRFQQTDYWSELFEPDRGAIAPPSIEKEATT